MRALLLALVVAFIPTVHAQDADLLDGLLAMMGAGGGANPRKDVGRLPAGVDARLLPSGARVAGGFTLGPEGGFGPVVAVAVLDGEPSAEAATYAGVVPPDGWALESRDPDSALRLYGPDAQADVVFMPRSAGGSFVVLSLVSFAGGARRSERPAGDGVVLGPDEDVELTLDEPAVGGPVLPEFVASEVGVVREIGSGPGRGTYARARFGGATLSAAEAEVRRAFGADGWRLLSTDDADGARVLTWARSDAAGPVVATVLLRAASGGVEATVTAVR